jgi:hypothetical protein
MTLCRATVVGKGSTVMNEVCPSLCVYLSVSVCVSLSFLIYM